MIICYLAGPIDYEEDKGRGWKSDLMSMCENNPNIGFFDPYRPFIFKQVDYQVASYIHDINMMALSRSTVLVGSLKRGQTSVGTPIEFYQCIGKKPMLILTDMSESVYMKYMESFDHVQFFTDINELYGKLLAMARESEEKFAQEVIQELDKGRIDTPSMGFAVARR